MNLKSFTLFKALGLGVAFIAVIIAINGQYHHRITDLQEDYFYKALLFKEFYRQNIYHILTHPGIPQVLWLSLIMQFFDNPIGSAVEIFYICYIVTIVANFMAIAYLYSSVTVQYLKLPAVSILLLWPPFWYYLTCYGADSFVIPLSILLLCLTWEWLCERDIRFKELKLIIIFQISILSLATKISLLPIVCACLLLLFIKISFEKLGRKKLFLLYILLSVEVYLIVKYSFNQIIYILIKWYSSGGAMHLRSDYLKIFDFNLIYLLLFAGTFFCIVFYAVRHIIFHKPMNCEFNWYGSILLIVIISLSVKAISLGGGFNPKALRNASPFVPAICFAFIAINGMVSSELREKLVMGKMHFKSIALIGSMMMLYVSLYNGHDSIEDIIKHSFSEAFYRDNIMNPSHYHEESGFHYYGNRVYGEGKFLLDLQNNFRNN